MKIFTVEEQKMRRERRMCERASRILEKYKDNPEYLERIHLLILVDILELFMKKKLKPEEAQLVVQAIQSERVQSLMNRLLDATSWMKTREGQLWIKEIEQIPETI